jgi:hypothetical protein
MLGLHHFYQQGFLPEPGGILDQDNIAVEAFMVIDDAIADAQREEIERAKKKAEADRRKAATKGRVRGR